MASTPTSDGLQPTTFLLNVSAMASRPRAQGRRRGGRRLSEKFTAEALSAEPFQGAVPLPDMVGGSSPAACVAEGKSPHEKCGGRFNNWPLNLKT